MRTASAAEIKGRAGGRKDLPRPGSALRAVYDALYAARGHYVVASHLPGFRSSYLNNLRNFYGCDIRTNRGATGGGSCLVGEWIGSHYVDYVKERFT